MSEFQPWWKMLRRLKTINLSLFSCFPKVSGQTKPHPKYLRHLQPHHSVQNISTHYHHRDIPQSLKKFSHFTRCKSLTSNAAVGVKEWERFILDNTETSHDHLTPEITLRLITPRCRLWSVPYSECEEAGVIDPYWAFYWPGGQALTRLVFKIIVLDTWWEKRGEFGKLIPRTFCIDSWNINYECFHLKVSSRIKGGWKNYIVSVL